MVYRIIISPEAYKQSSGTQINKSLEKFHLWPHKSQNGQTIYLSLISLKQVAYMLLRGVPTCTQIRMCVQLNAASIVF